MSVALKLDMPEGAFSALRKDPTEFTKELRLAAAVKWYELGMLSESPRGIPETDLFESDRKG